MHSTTVFFVWFLTLLVQRLRGLVGIEDLPAPVISHWIGLDWRQHHETRQHLKNVPTRISLVSTGECTSLKLYYLQECSMEALSTVRGRQLAIFFFWTSPSHYDPWFDRMWTPLLDNMRDPLKDREGPTGTC